MRIVSGLLLLSGCISGCALFPVGTIQTDHVSPIEMAIAEAGEDDCSTTVETLQTRECYMVVMSEEGRAACVRRHHALAQVRRESCEKRKAAQLTPPATPATTAQPASAPAKPLPLAPGLVEL